MNPVGDGALTGHGRPLHYSVAWSSFLQDHRGVHMNYGSHPVVGPGAGGRSTRANEPSDPHPDPIWALSLAHNCVPCVNLGVKVAAPGMPFTTRRRRVRQDDAPPDTRNVYG